MAAGIENTVAEILTPTLDNEGYGIGGCGDSRKH